MFELRGLRSQLHDQLVQSGLLGSATAASGGGAAAARSLSADEWVSLVGECQELANLLAAVQTLALAHLAATEDVVAEDGTIEEEFRGLGHQRLDAPDLVAPVLGLTSSAATDRMATAVDLVTRHAQVVHAMAEGRLDGYRAGIVAAELAGADADVCTLVLDRLEDRLGADTGGVLRARTRRLLAAVDPDLLRRKAERARAERSLRRNAFGVGVDEWSAKLPVEQSRVAWSVVDSVARSYVKDGTSPGIEQARADALLDLVNGKATGQVSVRVTVPASEIARHGSDAPETTEPGTTEPGTTEPGTTEPATAEPATCHVTSHVTATEPITEPASSEITATGPVPQAATTEAVGATDAVAGDTTLATQTTGYANDDGEKLVPVTGFGMPGVTHVRASWLWSLAGGSGRAPSRRPSGQSSASVVDVVACDDITGALTSLPVTVPLGPADLRRVERTARRRGDQLARSEGGRAKGSAGQAAEADRYRPPQWMVDFVKARDGRCRFPGCVVNARFCDVDHVVPWPVGATHPVNLVCLCRRHHRVKQRPRWRVQLDLDGTFLCTDPTGRQRTTLPVDHLQIKWMGAGTGRTARALPDPATSVDPTTVDDGSTSRAVELPSLLEEFLEHRTNGHLVDLACRPEHLTAHNRTALRTGRRISTHRVEASLQRSTPDHQVIRPVHSVEVGWLDAHPPRKGRGPAGHDEPPPF